LKTCNHCHETKPLEEFWVRSRIAGTRHARCIDCMSKALSKKSDERRTKRLDSFKKPISPAHLGWFAGFFDGEGSVSITTGHGTSYYMLTCSVSQTDRAPLDLFKQQFGGKVLGPYKRYEKSRHVYYWKTDCWQAEAFLRIIEPHLIVKRERARLGIEFRKLFSSEFIMPRGHQFHKFPEKREEILSLRRGYFLKMRELNKRGSEHYVFLPLLPEPAHWRGAEAA